MKKDFNIDEYRQAIHIVLNPFIEAGILGSKEVNNLVGNEMVEHQGVVEFWHLEEILKATIKKAIEIKEAGDKNK